MDLEGLEFHQKVREGYLILAKDNPSRIKVIDANQKVDEVFNDVIKEIISFLEE